MSIFSKTLERLGYVKKDEGQFTFDELFGRAGGPTYGRTRLHSQRAQLQAYLDWVYAVSTRIAQEASLIDIRAYANRGRASSKTIGKRIVNNPHAVKALLRLKASNGTPALEELDNHVSLDLLDSPNPVMDGQRLQEMTFLHMMLAGEAFWAIVRNGLGKPTQLWPMMPYGMKHVIGDDKSISSWVYRMGGKDVPFDAEDVLHFPLTNPNDMYRGMSVVRAAARAIETDNDSADWNRAVLKNGAKPDFVLQTDQKLDQEIVDRLRAQWNDEYGGPGNQGKVGILELGMKANTLSMSQKDMDFIKSRNFNRDQIFAMWGTSRQILGIIEGDGRSNMDAAEYSHAKRVIRPLMSREVSVLNHKLAPQYDPKLVYGFTDPVPEDKEFVLKERTESVNLYRTINEVRTEMGDDPIDGGDVLYIPGTDVPLSEAGQVTPPTDEATKTTRDGVKKKTFTPTLKSVRP